MIACLCVFLLWLSVGGGCGIGYFVGCFIGVVVKIFVKENCVPTRGCVVGCSLLCVGLSGLVRVWVRLSKNSSYN